MKDFEGINGSSRSDYKESLNQTNHFGWVEQTYNTQLTDRLLGSTNLGAFLVRPQSCRNVDTADTQLKVAEQKFLFGTRQVHSNLKWLEGG